MIKMENLLFLFSVNEPGSGTQSAVKVVYGLFSSHVIVNLPTKSAEHMALFAEINL